MTLRLECPYCRTAFAAEPTAAATVAVCPRCGEPVPTTRVAADGSPPAAAVSVPYRAGLPLLPLSLGATALVALAFGLWWWNARPKPPAKTDAAVQKPPPATLPPTALPALRYLPRDAQLVASFQPAALAQYAARTNQTAVDLLAEFGVPADLFTGLADAGLPLDSLAHVTLAADVRELPPRLTLVLALREPHPDPARLRQKLGAVVKDSTRRDVWAVRLPGVPLYTFAMTAAGDRAYLLSSTDAGIDAAKKPHAGLADFPVGLRESIERVSPSSLVWLATDAQDWSKFKALDLAAGFLKRPGLPKRLDGVRAAAASLSLEPDLTFNLGLRMADAARAAATADLLRDRGADLGAEVRTAGEWATASAPAEPPRERLPKLRALWE